MADAGNALLYILTNNAGVTAIISGRVFRKRLPQKPTYPAATFQLLDGPPMPDHDAGPSKDFKNLFQVDCWAEDYDEAVALRDAVVAATDNQKGLISGVNMQGLFLTDDRDMIDSEPEVYRRLLEFTMYTET